MTRAAYGGPGPGAAAVGKFTAAAPGAAAAVLLAAEGEAGWLEYVRGYARAHRWRTYHPLRSAGSEKGWPDLALCRAPRLILAELKTQNGRLRREQREWLDELERCDRLEVYRTWRPADRPQIHEVLR
jgi:VRR-NUC domain